MRLNFEHKQLLWSRKAQVLHEQFIHSNKTAIEAQFSQLLTGTAPKTAFVLILIVPPKNQCLDSFDRSVMPHVWQSWLQISHLRSDDKKGSFQSQVPASKVNDLLNSWSVRRHIGLFVSLLGTFMLFLFYILGSNPRCWIFWHLHGFGPKLPGASSSCEIATDSDSDAL